MTDPPVPGDASETRTSFDQHRLLTPGQLIAGRYRIEALVGVGGMGMVYRARDERLGVEVALKVLRPERYGDVQVLQRLEQELILARQVSHRNVVRIHDIGEDGELSFLTMDHVEGRSLKQVLEDERRLDADQVARIAIDLAEALAAAHREGVVHRDLKPANVLLDAGGRALVTDFGVARSLAGAGLTRAGNVVGTLEYLAPEQARAEQVDGRADIYALGLMMFEMLSGELPSRGATFQEVLAQRTTGRLRGLEEFQVAAPGWLRAAITRCLEPDPAKRYQDAAQLAADLAAHQASAARWRPGRRLLAGGAVATALLVATVLSLNWPGLRDTLSPHHGTVRVVGLLPLANLTGREELDWMSTGLAEMLAQSLAESPSLQVVDSMRVFRTVEDLQLDPGSLKPGELRRLGELLDVDRLVFGTLRQAEDRIRVEIRVMDLQLPVERAETVSGEALGPSRLFALAESLGRQLSKSLAVDAVASGVPTLSSDPEAMAAYAEGVERLLQGDSVAAAPSLQRAVEFDSEFPAAWVRLAAAYEQLGNHDRALAAAREAVQRLGNRSGRVAFEARARVAGLSGDFEKAQQILGALIEQYPHDLEAQFALAEALGEHGQLEQARRRLETIVAASPNHPRAWFLLGKYAILAGDSRAAVDEYLVRALVIQNKLGNRQGRADVQNAFGIAYSQLGERALAAERYHEAIALRREIGDERGVASATANLARISLREGQFDAARAGFQGALETFERIGDRQAAASLYNETGFLEEQQGEYRAALDHYRKALALLRDLGDQRALAETYNNVGFGYYLLGELDNAAVFARQAVQLYGDASNREGLMVAGQTVGLLEIARGNWDAALKALLEVLELSREIGDPQAQAMALGNLGRVAQYQGRFGAAQASYREALEVLGPLGDARGLLEFTLCDASLAFDVGMREAGVESLARAEAWLETSTNREQRAEWLRLKGRSQRMAGEVQAARRNIAAAVELAAGSGSVLALLAAGLEQAETALLAGETSTALASLEALHREAQDLGHLVLTLRAAELRARAAMAANDLAGAEQQLRTALQKARLHRPYAHTYRIHALLVEIMRTTGQTAEAGEHESAAAAELQRLSDELDPQQQEAFEQLDEVRRILASAEFDTAA